MHIVQNVWWLLVLIGVMILIHELGHYWAARFFDVKIEAFSFGFGPRLFGFKKGETDFRFSLILFGGYVKMAGEQPGEESTDPRAFLAKPRWQRLIIAFAGPFMNVVLAVGLLAGLFMVHYPKVPTVHSPLIGYIAPDSAAAKAGLREGDRIVQIDTRPMDLARGTAARGSAVSVFHSSDPSDECTRTAYRVAPTTAVQCTFRAPSPPASDAWEHRRRWRSGRGTRSIPDAVAVRCRCAPRSPRRLSA